MAKAVCPKCGAQIAENSSGQFTPIGEEKCIELRGTKYLDPSQIASPGIQWCPALSDAAPKEWMLLPPGHRPQVEKDIAAAKVSRQP